MLIYLSIVAQLYAIVNPHAVITIHSICISPTTLRPYRLYHLLLVCIGFDNTDRSKPVCNEFSSGT